MNGLLKQWGVSVNNDYIDIVAYSNKDSYVYLGGIGYDEQNYSYDTILPTSTSSRIYFFQKNPSLKQFWLTIGY